MNFIKCFFYCQSTYISMTRYKVYDCLLRNTHIYKYDIYIKVYFRKMIESNSMNEVIINAND